MLRFLAFFFYMSSFLIYSIPNLLKMKKLNDELPVAERDRLIHEMPKRWSRTIMKITGSNVTVQNQELIPEGPVVFVCNHEGDFDIPVLLAFIEKPFGFISKIEVKKVPILSTWMEVMNCVFLDRRNPRQAVRSIRDGVNVIKEGHSILIFPEGTRSKGGPIGEFKSGSFRLARGAEVPIVPIRIKGTANVFEKNGRLVKPANITVTVCEPIWPEEYKEKDLNVLANEVKNLISSI